MNLKKLSQIMLVGVFILFLSGPIFALNSGNWIVNIIITCLIGFGAYSLYMIYQTPVDQKTCWVRLIIGTTLIFLAYMILETFLIIGIA